MPSAADLATTGPLIAFASVLAGSPGIPVPSFAAIIFVGSLLATRHGSVGTGAFVFAAAMAGAVLGDVARFFAGRPRRQRSGPGLPAAFVARLLRPPHGGRLQPPRASRSCCSPGSCPGCP